MKKLFFLSVLLFSQIIARENPFEAITQPNIDTHIDEDIKEKIFQDFDFKLPSTARILKSVKIVYQNIDGSIEEQELPVDKSIDWHYPLTISQKDAKINENTDYVSAEKIIFFTKDNKLYITTNRKLERDFILPEPFRIILDLEKESSDSDRNIQLNQKYFSNITLTKYNNFYRAAITLDGHYKYKIHKTDDGYQIILE